jgi:putative MFS transporter
MFISWTIGSLYIGRLADKIGRRIPLLIAASGNFLFALLCAFAQNFWQLLIIRALYGIFLGFLAPITSTYLSEITPSYSRA